MRKFASLIVAAACVLVLTSCSLIPWRWFGPGENQVVRDKMAHIVEAINDQDAEALRAMFTDYALAEYSAEIDDGVAYLLSLFPDGDVLWRDDGHPTGSGSGLVKDGKKTWLGGTSYVVSSAGKEYTLWFSLFTENTIDPDNIGIYRMGAVLRTEKQDSGAELASCGRMDSDVRTGGPPGVFIGDYGGLSRDRALAVVNALNAHDVVALKGMFTEYARTNYSAAIDAGLEYLTSLFPDGDVVLDEGTGGSAVCERILGENRAVLLPTFYTVTAGGVDFRLFFADFTENTIAIRNVGIYALGAVPIAPEGWEYEPEVFMHRWAHDFYIGASAHPGVFIPEQ
jgi:hypothetical protein